MGLALKTLLNKVKQTGMCEGDEGGMFHMLTDANQCKVEAPGASHKNSHQYMTILML